MTTFESRFSQRIKEFSRANGVCPEESEYLLDCVPFIKEYYDTPQLETRRKKGALEGYLNVTETNNKRDLFQRYRATVEKDVQYHECNHEPWTCSSCGHEGVVIDSRESIVLCVSCGATRSYFGLTKDNLTYKEQTEQSCEKVTFAYKRVNHFIEQLNNLQAKENTEGPREVIEAVRAEYKKVRATKRSEITPEKVRAFLKKLKLNNYYDHMFSICNEIKGVPSPRLSPHLEDQLKHMFAQVQRPFDKYRPSGRKNFLSYNYTLYKMCELLGEDDLLPYFKLLKSPTKLHAQDCMWKNICKELGWQFIQTV